MIIGGDKQAVVANIKNAAEAQQWHQKVEVNDPVLDPTVANQVLQRYLAQLPTPKYRVNNWVADTAANQLTAVLNRSTRFVGLENLAGIGAGIVTSNHFNPLENTVIRAGLRQAGRKHLAIVSELTNLAMPGPVGYLMRYYDTIPIASDPNYMGRVFPNLLAQVLQAQHLVLIYPEQEMWFNYRKPRPPKRGPYYYAAKFQVPIVSCFVAMQALPKPDNQEFDRVQYTGYILKPIYPDPTLDVRTNSRQMMAQDWQQKQAAYERAYGEPYTPAWEPQDIVGWRGKL
ncbi:lysophospholipid acyltransferase family protein [Lactiplantibacillus daowaiensis]|uniref:Lysophospholipid acyltransferase family protein n=1 Tax=Lactiplantibacillus daowaiensis TaxID=2559918 RepID=A0ABW1S1B9_9LACO|nr:lysophospholipid acyltransferase family protein [Lactiplantibacillus daowaiensis]